VVSYTAGIIQIEVAQKIYGLNGNELHDEELGNLNISSGIVSLVEPSSLQRVRNVTLLREIRSAQRILRSGYKQNHKYNQRIALKWTVRYWDVKYIELFHNQV
jgi:hypothetical protein